MAKKEAQENENKNEESKQEDDTKQEVRFTSGRDEIRYYVKQKLGMQICKLAFIGCALQEITVPGSTKKIGDAFSACGKLTELTIPGSVMSFSPSILPNDDEAKLEKLGLSEGERMIQEGDFGYNLNTVYIPRSVTVIKNEGIPYFS